MEDSLWVAAQRSTDSDGDCDWDEIERVCLEADARIAELEKDVEQLRIQHRFGTPFDPTGAKTGTEINSLRQERDELRAGRDEFTLEACKTIDELRAEVERLRGVDSVFEMAKRITELESALARAAEALRDIQSIPGGPMARGVEAAKIASKALSAPALQRAAALDRARRAVCAEAKFATAPPQLLEESLAALERLETEQ